MGEVGYGLYGQGRKSTGTGAAAAEDDDDGINIHSQCASCLGN